MPYAHVISSFIGLQNYAVVRWKRHHKSWIEIWLEEKRRVWRCILCGLELSCCYDRPWVALRDLSISKHRTWLWVRRCRTKCPSCGIHRVELRIARPRARCTRRFERELFILTGDSTVKAVAKRQRVHWTTVKDAEILYIRALLRRRILDDIRDLGIDEVSEKKGHRYLNSR